MYDLIQARMTKIPPVLSTDKVHVWITDLRKASSDTEFFFKLLSYDEIKKAENYTFEIDKDRYIYSRGILRILVSAYTGGVPGNVKFSYSPAGKPYLCDNEKNSLKFNLSHSGDFAIYGFTLEKEIGIDMEYLRELEYIESLAIATLSDIELKNFSAMPKEEMHGVFFRYWTHKEAYLKATGQGVADSIKNIEFILDSSGRLNLAKKNGSGLNMIWNFHEIIPEKNYTAVLAIPDRNCGISLFRLDGYNI